jgi:hypothetical protein
MPDTRNPTEVAKIFLAPNEIVGGDHQDEFEEQKGENIHEAIELDERRKSSIYSSGKSESTSSVEVPQRNSTVDMGKKEFLLFKKRNILMKLTYEIFIHQYVKRL